MKRNLTALLLIFLSGCLCLTLTLGCVTHGSRTVKIEFFGQKIEVSDHTENDTRGQPDFWVTIDDWLKKIIDTFRKPPTPEAPQPMP